MNERIRELAEQAGFVRVGDWGLVVVNYLLRPRR